MLNTVKAHTNAIRMEINYGILLTQFYVLRHTKKMWQNKNAQTHTTDERAHHLKGHFMICEI